MDHTLPASEARKKKGKTKKRKSEAEPVPARPADGIYSFHPEDSTISEVRIHCPATSRVNQEC